MGLHNPILVGFGIRDKATFDTASKYTAGAIIGSAYIKALQKGNDIQKETRAFLEAVKG